MKKIWPVIDKIIIVLSLLVAVISLLISINAFTVSEIALEITSKDTEPIIEMNIDYYNGENYLTTDEDEISEQEEIEVQPEQPVVAQAQEQVATTEVGQQDQDENI